MTNTSQAKPESVPADALKPAVSAPPAHGPLMRDGQQEDPGVPPAPTSPKGQLNRARAARLVRRKRF
ncbi:MAG TPA: hypothetical protein VMD53_13505 [Rhizomicrobium sp.]|nr:hypothetical protein [Rhizomicrobium sp.]